MNTILNQLYLPYISQLGFYPATGTKRFKECGIYYELDPSIGTGYYWVYPVDNLFAVSIYDTTFISDVSYKYKHPPFIYIGHYSTSNTGIYPGEEEHSDNFITYMGTTGIHQSNVVKGFSMNSVGISMTPEFYEKYLTQKYSWRLQDLKQTLSKLNNNKVIPEIIMVFNQIRTFNPDRDLAKMYYEGKIIELLSLMMQWSKKEALFPITKRVPDLEMEHLRQVEAYLNKNYVDQVSLNSLTKIACMSHNKLTSSFKLVYGSTITEYIQALRVNKAKDLLLNTDYKIGRVAKEVGYKLHGSFTDIFKRYTGFTPNEFRKHICIKDDYNVL